MFESLYGQADALECELHTLIHTFAVWVYLPHVVTTELEIALHPLDPIFHIMVEIPVWARS